MKRLLAASLALAALSAPARAGQIGPDAFGYVATDNVSSGFVDISPTGTKLFGSTTWDEAGWSVRLSEMAGRGDSPQGLWNAPQSEPQNGQAPVASPLPLWLGHSGGGERGPTGGSGLGSTVLDASTTAPPGPPLMEIGPLFLDEHFYRPPPFASRLFRPPRVV